MEPRPAERREVIMGGIGGQGLLVAGQLLGQMAVSRYKHVVEYPVYQGTQQRGGSNECTVVMSDEEIDSPMIDRAEAVLIFDISRLKEFQKMVLPGGILIVNGTDAEAEVETEAGRVLWIPAMKLALDAGSTRAMNLVLLGAYIEATKAFPIEMAVEALRENFGDREDVLSHNTKALLEGAKAVASMKH